MLDRKQSELGAGWGSYAVILLVSSLGSLTIAKFNGLNVHCFVVAHFSDFVRILLSDILSIYYCMWTIYVNVTILRKYSGNGHACASSRYQAVFLLPHSLGTRLPPSQPRNPRCSHSINTSETISSATTSVTQDRATCHPVTTGIPLPKSILQQRR